MSQLPTPEDEQRVTADVQRRLFAAKIRRGILLVKLGLFGLAQRYFRDAATVAKSRAQVAESLQWRGITHRLQGNLSTSIEMFKAAIALTEDNTHLQGRLYRDLAMTIVAQLRKAKHGPARKLHEDGAEACLLKSQSLLNTTGDSVELAATYGFHGRLCALVGNPGQARSYYARADTVLKGGDNRDYELNNLIWMLKVATPQKRAAIRSRIWPLIWQTRQFRRVHEVVATTIMLLISDMKGEK